MRYTIYRAVKQLLSHKFIYILFMLQITLGIALISVSLNYWLSADRVQKKMKESVQTQDTVIEGLRLGEEGNFGYEDYLQIQKITEGKSALHVAVKSEDTYFVYGEEADQHTMLKGSHAAEDSDSGNYNVQVLPKQLEKKGIVAENEWVQFSDSVLLPLEEIQNLTPEELASSEYYVVYLIQAEKIKDSGKVLNDIVKYLEKKTPTENFTFVTPAQQIDDQLRYELIIPNYLGKLAAAAILVMVCGFSGVMNLHMKKREKEMAVCIAVGATFYSILAELFIEVFAVYVCGGMFGNLLSMAALRQNSLTTLFAPSYSPAICMVTIVLILLLTVIVMVRPAHRVKCISAAALLNSI